MLVSLIDVLMLPISDDILKQYDTILSKKAVSQSLSSEYKKWLRYYLDFSSKYTMPDSRSEQVRLFIEKLRQKKQSQKQQEQAAYALSLFFWTQPDQKKMAPPPDKTKATLPENPSSPTPQLKNSTLEVQRTVPSPPAPRTSGGKRFGQWRSLVKTKSPEWDKTLYNLAAEIKIRHYSKKTLKTYADWTRKFQSFLKNKPPEELTATEVKDYLTYLAVNCKVAASTQNQAFNALLFLYRHILKKDFGDHKDIPRAKKSRYIPVVLSRSEIDAVLKHLEYPYDLAVKLLYGCGLRLFECVALRIKNFNFDA
jgi:site-specific recombinase XerD